MATGRNKNWHEDLQLSISKEVNNRLLVYYSDDKVDKVVIRLFLDQTLASYQDLFQQIPQHVHTQELRLRVHDGLLCLCDTNNSRISLWNPATRKYRLLRECNENIPPKAWTYAHHIGFGSDSSTNDYKVIYFRRYKDWGMNILGMPPNPYGSQHIHLAVYRMSTDSWRLLTGIYVEIFEDLYFPDDYSSSACVNGVNYWVAIKFEFYKVLAFHFSNEVFQLIDWPPVPEPKLNVELLRLPDNRISLWFPDFSVYSICHDIWVLNEDGQYWTKLLRIGPLSGVERIFGFRNKNLNKIYVASVDGELLLYDLDTQELRDIEMKSKKGWDLLEVCTFEESLISVG
ncbi:hypothetical protein PTKIN_Ptkin16aG0094200 [Pterospermum kingtungense]